MAQIEIGGRICYLVDPELRVSSDSFPIGILRGKYDPILQFDALEHIAIQFEAAHRRGVSWLAKDSMPDDIVALPIRRSRLETADQKRRFSERAARLVIDLIYGKGQLSR